jgi:hypothetical protein
MEEKDLKEMLDAAERTDGEIERVLQAIREVRQQQRKRLYQQAKRDYKAEGNGGSL